MSIITGSLISEKLVFEKFEVCPGLCPGRESINEGREKAPFQIYSEDQDGFTWCNVCHRPWQSQLKQCPECHKFFRGPSPYKPLSIDYECPECE